VAIKSTSLSFGLVTVPVSLKKGKATDKSGPSFTSCTADGRPVKQVYVAERVDEETGEITEEIVGTIRDLYKGIPDGDKFSIVPKDVLDTIANEGKIESLVVDGFIALDEVPTERVEGVYFLSPSKDTGTAGGKTLALLRDGLRQEKVAGIGKLTLRTTQRPFVMYEDDGVLVVNVLGFANTYTPLAAAKDLLPAAEADAKTLALFSTLVSNLKVPTAQLDEYVDEVIPKKEALIEAVLAGEAIETTTVDPEIAATVDLESALVASIAQAA
jgi:DNA end-binding protein Ku